MVTLIERQYKSALPGLYFCLLCYLKIEDNEIFLKNIKAIYTIFRRMGASMFFREFKDDMMTFY